MPQETTHPKTIYLIRHGETGFVKEGRFYGSTDLPLSDEGREQARQLGLGLSTALGPSFHCYTSPLQRAQETLRLALPGIQAEIEPALREIDFGKCEGMTMAEIQEHYPEILKAWVDFTPSLQFPGGERLADYLKRVQTFTQRLAADPKDTLVVFGHGGVLRSLLCHFLHLPAKHYTNFTLPCTGVAVVTLTDGYGVLSRLGMLA